MAGRDKAAEQLKEFKKTQLVSQGTHPFVIQLVRVFQFTEMSKAARHFRFIV